MSWCYRTVCCLVSLAIVISAQQQTLLFAQDPGLEDRSSGGVMTLPIPPQDVQGRPIWPIGVYQSQLADVVPADFRPVPIEELRAALNAAQSGHADKIGSRLVSSFYDVRLTTNLLSSERSEIVIDSALSDASLVDLGEVNLAIGRSNDSYVAGAPRLLVGESGNLMAVVSGRATDKDEDDRSGVQTELQGRSKAVFSWSFTGTSSGSAQRFELRIPRTPQTRFVISTPDDVILESRNGVLSERPSPPPDADLQGRATDVRWYVLEAGGLNRIELIVHRAQTLEQSSAIVVRRESKQYEVDVSGVTWTHRIGIEFAQPKSVVRLFCPLGTVASVRVNANRVEPTQFEKVGTGTIITIPIPDRIRSPSPAAPDANDGKSVPESTAEPTLLTITGSSSWDRNSGVCALPSISIREPNIVWGEISTQAVVTVIQPLEVARWELPDNWLQSREDTEGDLRTLLVATGPPHDNHGGPPWSMLRLHSDQSVSFDGVLLGLQLDDGGSSLLGKGEVVCRMSRISPIALEVEPKWNIDSITLPESGREVAFESGEGLVIWPTSSDLTDGAVTIVVHGHRSLPPDRRWTIPESWMIRPRDCVTPQTSALKPPKGRKWDGGSVMLVDRLDEEQLDDRQRRFLSPESDTLLFYRSHDGSPEVALEPMNVTYDVSLRHELGLDNGNVLETIFVELNSSNPITSVTVQTANAHDPSGIDGLSRFRWSLRRSDPPSIVSIPDSRTEMEAGNEIQTYVLQSDDRELVEYELVGQRSYPATSALELVLPSVREAATQRADTFVSSDWRLRDIPPGAQLVPSSNKDSGNGYSLRYDSAETQSIRLERSLPGSGACLVWEQRIDVLASSRGEDRFHLSALVSSSEPIVVEFDSDLELASIAMNGKSDVAMRSRSGRLQLNPEGASDRLSITLRRRHNNRNWIRLCKLPRISIKGSVFSHQITCKSEEDSLLVASSFGSSIVDRRSAFRDGEGAPGWIVMHRNVALALGWIGTLAFFAFPGHWPSSSMECAF